MEQINYDVFISYSRKDYLSEDGIVIPDSVITAIMDAFNKNDITYWIDENGDLTGNRFAHVIAEKIRESRVFLFVCSKHSVYSKWVERELSVADVFDKKIIPFVCDDSYLNNRVVMYTASLGHVSYSENHQKGLSRLVESVKKETSNSIVDDRPPLLHKVQQNNHWGFADASGQIVVPCNYNAVTYFQEGLACVESDKRKWGFVDEKGREVIPCKWEDVGFFSEGLAYVEDAFWKIGFIDKKGKVVIPCKWEDAISFSHGIACVKGLDGKWLKIDKTGKLLEE